MVDDAKPARISVRLATPADDPTVAAMFRSMWRAIGVAEDALVPSAEGERRVLEFLDRGRREAGLSVAVAERFGVPLGCAVCQRYQGLYPDLLAPETRRYGYIWGVYVDAAHRGRGLGARLTRACMDRLRDDGCTHAVLNTAPKARGLYERLGFEAHNSMLCAL